MHTLRISAAFLAASLLASPASAQSPESEEDSDIVLLMQEMDGAIEDLEPFIGAQNKVEALDAALFLQDALVWTGDYFATQPDKPDGLTFAQAGRETAALVVAALEAADFEAALEHARALSDNCGTCHDAYRP